MTNTNNEVGRKTRKQGLSKSCDFGADAAKYTIAHLRLLLEETLALHARTMSFQHYVSRPYAHDFVGLLEEQAEQISTMVNLVAARIRALGGANRLFRRMARLEVTTDGEAASRAPLTMLSSLRESNAALILRMIELYDLCDDTNDLATAGLLQNWIDETRRRVWFLSETNHKSEPTTLQ